MVAEFASSPTSAMFSVDMHVLNRLLKKDINTKCENKIKSDMYRSYTSCHNVLGSSLYFELLKIAYPSVNVLNSTP